MAIVEDMERALKAFPDTTKDADELARLQDFLNDMKVAGVARTREYDLPLPDAIGRSTIEPGREVYSPSPDSEHTIGHPHSANTRVPRPGDLG